MSEDDFEEFLNDATQTVAELWATASGQTLVLDPDKYALNSHLEAFFGERIEILPGEDFSF